MLVSFIVPLYNEEKRVAKAVTALTTYLDKVSFSYEVLFINDGSTDQTVAAIDKLNPKFKYEVISYTPNQGKGNAVRVGMKQSRGDWRLLLDVDMSTPLGEFDRFIPFLKEDTVVIGSRKRDGAHVVRHQPFLREKMGQVFTLIASLLIAPGISDFTCGFKCFSAKAAKKIFGKTIINRWSYDAEILFLARKFGYTIKEVPVKWADDPRTRVTLLRDSIESFIDLLRIRVVSLLGKYN